MISQGLENFLDYLRATEQQLHIAEQSEQEANDATQDILHRLELLLGEVRKQERRAKDRIYTPKTSILEGDSQ